MPRGCDKRIKNVNLEVDTDVIMTWYKELQTSVDFLPFGSIYNGMIVPGHLIFYVSETYTWVDHI